MDVSWHHDVTNQFTIILKTVIIQAIDDGNNKRWACEDFDSIVDVAGDIED